MLLNFCYHTVQTLAKRTIILGIFRFRSKFQQIAAGDTVIKMILQVFAVVIRVVVPLDAGGAMTPPD